MRSDASESKVAHFREEGREQGCQMAKFDPFLSLDGARVEGWGQRSVAEP